jgi:peptidoglycan hydrolase CwlO-like protein
MGKFNLKDQLAGIAALIAAIVAIGGGFVKYGEITTKLDALEQVTGPNLAPITKRIDDTQTSLTITTEDMLENTGEIKVLQKEIELLKLQIEEIKISTSNPLSQ